ncbi:DUF5330 domain-containing protein [Neorhizobium alkalisoli]|jgi:hypothetical protein|uniref:DUF5330 domain-containing protein n=1 Tax=Neorhizobium alkalisoli TaxID=528178 RepID=A0A561QWH7_9HYPH|nr:DUF5330 domain-containing protein [Neorhizobium alkalisoli]TWF54724.1 hypothetical protein FHW37_103594 [Neorhizobium alkalisoli]
MWFLIKGSVFFAAVLVVLSYFSAQKPGDDNSMSPLQVADAFSAATQAYQYVSAICTEKPDVCEKGADTFSALGVRAREGAKVAFDLLDRQFGTKEAVEPQIPSIAVKADPDLQPLPEALPQQQAALYAPIVHDIHTGTIPLPQKRPLR